MVKRMGPGTCRGSRVCVGCRSWRRLHGTLSQPPPSPALVIEHPLYKHGRPDSALSNPFCYNITILNTSNTDFVIQDLQLPESFQEKLPQTRISIPKAQYGEVVSTSPSSLLGLVLCAPSSGDGSSVVASTHVLSCSTNALASFHRLQSSLVNQISSITQCIRSTKTTTNPLPLRRSVTLHASSLPRTTPDRDPSTFLVTHLMTIWTMQSTATQHFVQPFTIWSKSLEHTAQYHTFH